jgi:flagellar biosynthesis/type III secretory pathway chaperone
MAQLAQLFHQQIGALVELQALLTLETNALVEGRDGTIVRIAADKQAVLDRLTGQARELETLLRENSLTPTKEGLTTYIRQTDPSGELGAIHDQVTRLLRTCRMYNQTNGVVLQRRRSATERALRVLFQHQGAPDRYSAAGRLDGPGAYRSIGEA